MLYNPVAAYKPSPYRLQTFYFTFSKFLSLQQKKAMQFRSVLETYSLKHKTALISNHDLIEVFDDA